MNLQVGDLIPLQGLTKEDKRKLVDIVNKAEANQSTIKANIASKLNEKLGSNLNSSSTWIDIQNTLDKILQSSKGSKYSSSSKFIVDNLTFTPRKVIVKYKGDSQDADRLIVLSANGDMNFYNTNGKDYVDASYTGTVSSFGSKNFDENTKIIPNGFKVYVNVGTIDYWAFE